MDLDEFVTGIVLRAYAAHVASLYDVGEEYVNAWLGNRGGFCYCAWVKDGTVLRPHLREPS